MNKNIFFKEKINNKNISLGFFSRKGGLSIKSFNSLNCNIKSGDDIVKVQKNIKIALNKIELQNSQLKLVSQIHSNKVEFINKKNLDIRQKCDGIITQDKSISLGILTADCTPIFFYDSDLSFISAIHAGWKGCLKNIVKETIMKIKKIQPESHKIKAIIGPCLDKSNFEVSLDFKKNFIEQNYNYAPFFKKKTFRNKDNFDMRGLINYQLRSASIINIENVNFDTYQNNDLFFSHRRTTHEKSLKTGRMINIIGFNNPA